MELGAWGGGGHMGLPCDRPHILTKGLGYNAGVDCCRMEIAGLFGGSWCSVSNASALLDVADHCLGEKAIGVGLELVIDAASAEQCNHGMRSQWARLTGVRGAVMCGRG